MDARGRAEREWRGLLSLRLVIASIVRIKKRDGKEVVVKTDERGRTIDILALHRIFGTHLCRAGAPLLIA